MGASLDWLRKNLEPQPEQNAQHRKESRSQSLVPTASSTSSNASKKLLTHQRSLDYDYNNPFDEEDELELHGESKILKVPEDAKFISKLLPPRLTGNGWYQIFSTGILDPGLGQVSL